MPIRQVSDTNLDQNRYCSWLFSRMLSPGDMVLFTGQKYGDKNVKLIAGFKLYTEKVSKISLWSTLPGVKFYMISIVSTPTQCVGCPKFQSPIFDLLSNFFSKFDILHFSGIMFETHLYKLQKSHFLWASLKVTLVLIFLYLVLESSI